MSRNGSGTYTLPAGNPVVTGTTISSTWANNTLTDIATALTGSLAADGQTTATGNLKLGNNRITGLADGIAATDAPSLTQVTSAVAITGGAIDGTTIGTTTRSSVKATTLDLGLATQSVAIGQGNASIMKNRIINGAMVIDQRNAGASVTPASSAVTYTLDRFGFYVTQASKMTVQQNAGSVTPPVGFKNYLGVTSTSAYSVASGDIFEFFQNIEGFNTSDLMFGTASAKTITISFQVYSSLTGTFGGSVQNAAQNRSYPFTYSIPVANTWTTISITVAGDTTGTWVGASNSTGISLIFSMGSGSTYSGTAGAWASANYTTATGATSVVGTSGATFYITGVQLEVGSSATGFEYRQYGQELALCQRYLPAGGFNGSTYSGQVTSTTTNLFTIPFQVTTRVAPTGVVVNSPTAWGTTNAVAAGIAASTVTFSGASVVAGSLIVTIPSASLVAGNASLAYADSAIAYFTGCEL
jgi:hypothetical protein